MGLLSDRIRLDGLNAGSLFAWLGGQRHVIGATPASLLQAAGLGSGLRTATTAATSATTRVADEARQSMRWLWPVAAALLLAVGAWALWSRSRDDIGRVPQALLDTGTRMATDLGALIARRLPNGVELRIPTRGMEGQLIQ